VGFSPRRNPYLRRDAALRQPHRKPHHCHSEWASAREGTPTCKQLSPRASTWVRVEGQRLGLLDRPILPPSRAVRRVGRIVGEGAPAGAWLSLLENRQSLPGPAYTARSAGPIQ
jgi:hypothetical protein